MEGKGSARETMMEGEIARFKEGRWLTDLGSHIQSLVTEKQPRIGKQERM